MCMYCAHASLGCLFCLFLCENCIVQYIRAFNYEQRTHRQAICVVKTAVIEGNNSLQISTSSYSEE